MAKQANSKSWGLYTHGDGSRRSYPGSTLAAAALLDSRALLSAAAQSSFPSGAALRDGPNPLSSSGTVTSGGGGGGPPSAVFYDNFQDRNVGNVFRTINPEWTNKWAAKGYSGINGASDDTTSCSIKDRTFFTSGLLSDPNCPAGKTRFLRCFEAGMESEAIIYWRSVFAGLSTRDVHVSWWEYRPNGNQAGEKFLRFDTFAGTSPPTQHQPILYRDNAGVMGWLENHGGGNVNGHADAGATSVPWNGTLAHWEVRLKLSTGTNSDGLMTVWKDGTQVMSATGVKNNVNATGATYNIEQICLGGWNSGSGTWPIERIFLAFAIATTRQNVWSIV